MVVAIPHPVDVVDAHSFGPIDGERHPGYARTNLTGAIVAIGAALTIPVVDLFAPFRNAEDPAALYFKTDDHWTPPGQDLAADVTAAFIVREGLGG